MRALILALLLLPTAVLADDRSPQSLSPADVGVRVEKPAGDGTHFSQGSGVFIGRGLVLTAAHVVKVDPANTKVTVLLDGWRLDGTLVFDGQRENVDLALILLPPEVLSEKRRTQAQVPVCAANPGPNQPVAVASMGTVTNAATIPTAITSDLQTGTWTNLLSTGFHQGNSGGGVFNPQQGCLWGILNMEMSGPSQTNGQLIDLTAFVPASKITPFLDEFRQQNR
ncbi:serine protease [Telmatospirillum sp.]|uniref:S1 family peptidase n=1 Tax=Telmatospirillum sp. TaxID=2079197 RepID=UPI00283D1D32|nr:serine protease [Telmatospirillum sp.]MDR3438048.1 serine protease [Telmatospirillum sp.]